MCGILTDRDIAMKVTGEQRDPLTTMVEEVMTRDPVRISVDRDVRDVMSLMHTHPVRRIPIIDTLETVPGIVIWMISLHCLETKSLKWGAWSRNVKI